MTWLGNSILNLKDQITTLTKDALAQADEDQEQPKFIPVEKFNRLLKICEEKEEQVCQLQQEVYALRGQSLISEDGKLLEGENSGRVDETLGLSEDVDTADEEAREKHQREKKSESVEAVDSECPSTSCFEEQFSPFVEHERHHVDKNQISSILQRIENLDEKDRLHQLHSILKEVKCLYEREKQSKLNDGYSSLSAAGDATKMASNEAAFTLAAGNLQPGIEETMSNDSDRSEDSLLNDFEVLKSRGTSKSSEEFAVSSAEAQTQCTQLTRSTSTQSEYDFSVVNKGTQTSRREDSGPDAKEKDNESNATSFSFLVNIDDELTGEKFWSELKDPQLKDNDSLRKSIVALIEENRRLNHLCRSVNNRGDDPSRQATKITECESPPEESIKLKKTTIAKHVDELNTYSKKLENFNSSLNEVSEELLDQTVELNSLYCELKSSTETREQLRQENTELKSIIGQMRVDAKKAETKSESEIAVQELTETLTQLRQRNEDLQTAYKKEQELVSITKEQLNESQEAVRLLKEEVDENRKATANRDEQLVNELRQQIDDLKNQLEEQVQYSRSELTAHSNTVSSLEHEVESLKSELHVRDNAVRTLELKWQDAIRWQDGYASKCGEVDILKTECLSYKSEIEHLNNLLEANNARYKRIVEDVEAACAQTANLLLKQKRADVVGSLQSKIMDIEKHVKSNINAACHDCVIALPNTTEYISQLVQLGEDLSSGVASLVKQMDAAVDSNQRCKLQVENLKMQFVLSDGAGLEDSSVAGEQKEEGNLQADVYCLSRNIEELEKINEILRAEMEIKSKRINQSDEVEKKLGAQIESLMCRVEELNGSRDDLKRKVTELLENREARHSLLEVLSTVEKFIEFTSEEEGTPWQAFICSVKLLCEEDNSRLNELLTSQVQRYEEQISELKNRVSELEQCAASKTDDSAHMSDIVSDLEAKLSTIASERDQVITSLKEKHSENLFYHSELQKVHALFVAEVEKNKDLVRQIQELKQKSIEHGNAVAELERLREHLLSVEQTYTNELLNAEEQIKELQRKVKDYEVRIQSLNAAQTSVNVRANQISESLQKEVKTLSVEKEQLAANLRNSQAELQKVIHDAQNLRSALDLFHRNKDSEEFHATEKFRNDIKRLENENSALNETVQLFQSNLEMMKKTVNEKKLLQDDIESKKEIISRLEKQVEYLQNNLAQTEAKVVDLEANTENKFKIDLLKNVFLRYITSNTDSMKSQALHILYEVLDFSPEERQKLGLPTHGDEKQKNEVTPSHNSLLDEFIRFVENESDPREKKRSEKKASTSNILFASPTSLPDVMLPTLSQHSMGQNSMYILKDVLQ